MTTLRDTFFHRERGGEFAHWCDQWNDILIDETDVEFLVCTCFSGTPAVKEIQERLWKEHFRRMGI